MDKKIFDNTAQGNSLKFAFWNIEGYNSRTIGKKFLSADFLNEIAEYDVIGLAETHIHSSIIEDLFIPGFHLLSYVNRTCNSKSKTAPGGLAVFCKNNLSNMFVPIERNSKDALWVKVKKDFIGLPYDIYLGTIYHSPSGNKNETQKTYQELTDDVSLFQGKGLVILQGDFNAITKQETDFITNDEFTKGLDLENYSTVPARNSEDTRKTNLRGEEMLELCKTLNMNILNGRKIGDLFGRLTSFQWNGNGVVDYVISSHDLFPHISYLQVGSYIPWVSDHCPLLYKLSINNTLPTNEDDLKDSPERFYFNNDDKNRLRVSLKSTEMSVKFNLLQEIDECDTALLATGITTTLIEATKLSNIKSAPKKSHISTKNPWFDKECQKVIKSLKRKCKNLRAKKNDINLKMEILNENKLLKNLVKKKKANYKLKILEEMGSTKTDQKTFWKLLDKIHTKSKKVNNSISGKNWENHFKSILRSNHPTLVYPDNSLEEGPLDYEIVLEELLEASYILKPNKSAGYDTITNEMICCLIEVNPRILIKLFNNILKKNVEIQEWIMSIITPIHKSGIKTDPSNYRGIAVLSCLGKLFTSILNLRLRKFVSDNNILRKEQLGFVEGNRTSDAHLILHSLIQDYCHKKGKKIYGCFVDFKKAFDSVPRELLFQKLLKIGITGKFFNVLKTMYNNDNCCVRVGDKITNTFLVNQGVKQGCVLSPLLFNIFLSDLPELLTRPECRPVKLANSEHLGGLFWADDVIMLSESDEGLLEMITKLGNYSKHNFIEINISKTKGMVFNKPGRFYRHVYKLGNDFISTTNSYKYLGFIFTPSGEIHSGLKDLKDRALRAYYKLKLGLGQYFRLHVITTIFLFNALIKPILLYSADFWGCLKLPKNNPIENVHIRFCKDLLGVQRQTTNIGVLLELGEIPISIYAKKQCIKNFHRIHIKKANWILLSSMGNTTNSNCVWHMVVKTCLDRLGLGGLDTDVIQKKAFERMKDIFYQEAFLNINRPDSKLRTFAKLKTSIGMEKYLISCLNLEHRTAITKLRLSNHDLCIERGRHLGIDKSERYCPFCPNIIETEEHFLLQCTVFDTLRSKYLKFELRPPNCNLEFIYLLTEESALQHVGIFLHKAFQLRKYLCEKHKNHL